ncbi:MAG: UDP-4-amino-4,6-dideoxy-N-acetyl-beta-L-altrosamine transaminase [Thermoleophilaceae bacterium]
MRFLPYGRQQIDDADVEAVAEALRSELITQGPRVGRLEEAMAAYLGTGHSVALSSGTAALHAAAFAAGLGPGDEAITSPITFAASANCARYLGADVRFVDIDPATWNLDTAAAAAQVSERTRAILPVSYAGLPVDLDPLEPVRERVTVIEDGCHAIGGHRNGVKVGGAGGADMTAFSFHPVKTMTTGEGGLVATDDARLARRVELFRTHGITREDLDPGPDEGAWYYEMRALGFNYRITDVQCALGLSQRERLDRWVARRNEIAARYRELLAGEERIELPPAAPPGSLHGYHLFPVRVRDGARARRRAFDALRAAGIGVQVHYIPLYRMPYYRDELGYPQDTCPNAERLYAGLISLPMFPAMTGEDIERVVEELAAALP